MGQELRSLMRHKVNENCGDMNSARMERIEKFILGLKRMGELADAVAARVKVVYC